jgi:hypothetical protein
MARNSSEHKMGRKMKKTLKRLTKDNPNLKVEKKNGNSLSIKDTNGNTFMTHCGAKLFHPMRRWLNDTNNTPSFRVC